MFKLSNNKKFLTKIFINFIIHQFIFILSSIITFLLIKQLIPPLIDPKKLISNQFSLDDKIFIINKLALGKDNILDNLMNQLNIYVILIKINLQLIVEKVPLIVFGLDILPNVINNQTLLFNFQTISLFPVNNFSDLQFKYESNINNCLGIASNYFNQHFDNKFNTIFTLVENMNLYFSIIFFVSIMLIKIFSIIFSFFFYHYIDKKIDKFRLSNQFKFRLNSFLKLINILPIIVKINLINKSFINRSKFFFLCLLLFLFITKYMNLAKESKIKEENNILYKFIKVNNCFSNKKILLQIYFKQFLFYIMKENDNSILERSSLVLLKNKNLDLFYPMVGHILKTALINNLVFQYEQQILVSLLLIINTKFTFFLIKLFMFFYFPADFYKQYRKEQIPVTLKSSYVN